MNFLVHNNDTLACDIIFLMYFIPPMDVEIQQTIERFKQEQLEGRPFILINLFASGKHRNFSPVDAEKLIRWFLDHYLQDHPQHVLALLRVPGQEGFLEKLVGDIKSAHVMITPAPASMVLSFALIEEAQLVVSPDTALVQFCNALTPRLVAIYQNNDRNFGEWKPLNPNAQIIFTRPAETAYDRVNVAEFSFSELTSAVDKASLLRIP